MKIVLIRIGIVLAIIGSIATIHDILVNHQTLTHGSLVSASDPSGWVQPIVPGGTFANAVIAEVNGPIVLLSAKLIPFENLPLPELKHVAVATNVDHPYSASGSNSGESRTWPAPVSPLKLISIHHNYLTRGQWTIWDDTTGKKIGTTYASAGIAIMYKEGTSTRQANIYGLAVSCVLPSITVPNASCDNFNKIFDAYSKIYH
jgi:hypothetical protein